MAVGVEEGTKGTVAPTSPWPWLAVKGAVAAAEQGTVPPTSTRDWLEAAALEEAMGMAAQSLPWAWLALKMAVERTAPPKVAVQAAKEETTSVHFGASVPCSGSHRYQNDFPNVPTKDHEEGWRAQLC